MRILLDLQSCQSGSRKGGIGRYSMELAKAMARQADQHELWLALSSLLPEPIAEIRSEFSNLVCQDKIRVFNVPPSIAELSSNKARVRAAELIREEFINSLKPDVIHVTSLFEGLQEDVVTSVGKLSSRSDTAVTLYDLIPLVQQDRYLANKDARNHYLEKVSNLKEADILLSISEFSKNEAIDVLGISSEKIVNISSAADERFKPLSISKEVEIGLLKKYGISRRFLMYTGSFDQRKNQAKLIEAFSILPGRIRRNYQLVIVGNGWDSIYQELRTKAKILGLADDEVIFAGHIADGDLLPLYNLCYLFVFPSLAEGFGLPILEAMSCGTPAIGSNCTSIPEVIGWSEALFDPKSAESIANKISDALLDEGFYKKLQDHALKQSKKFSWDKSARIALDAFQSRHEKKVSTLKGRIEPKVDTTELYSKLSEIEGITTLPDGALLEMAQSIAANQYQAEVIRLLESNQKSNLAIGWITTWNTKCGIAAYSHFLIKNFPSEAIIFAAHANEIIEKDEANIIRCWNADGGDDLRQLYEEIRKSEIKVILIQFNYGFFDFDSFSVFLQLLKHNGIRVFITFHSTSDPSESKRLMVLRDALSICDGLIVHSMSDVATLKKYNLNNINYLPQGILETKAIEPSDIIKYKNKKIIATYGFALPSKGLKETVQAFSILRQKYGDNYHLLMINAEYPDPMSAKYISEIKDLIREHNLVSCVTFITDYLPDEVSIEHLQNADLIIYSYQKTGESSSAAVRMGLAARKPVAVTPINIFEDVKTSVFFFASCGVNDIFTGIHEILSHISSKDSEAIKISNSAQLWIESHKYSSVSKQLYWMLAEEKPLHVDYELAPVFSLTQDSKPQSFIPESDVSLQTIVGRFFDKIIETTGREGYLLFGPFLSVAPGTYKVVIRGDMVGSDDSFAVADVASKSGSCILAKSNISKPQVQGIISSIEFNIPEEGCKDLEVRVWVSEHTVMQISMIEFTPLLK